MGRCLDCLRMMSPSDRSYCAVCVECRTLTLADKVTQLTGELRVANNALETCLDDIEIYKTGVTLLRGELGTITQERDAAQPLITICRQYVETPGRINRVALWSNMKQALARIDQVQEGQGDDR